MTKLVLSSSNSQLLRRLGKQSKSKHHAVQSLKTALDEQPEQAKMTVQSPAVPTTSFNDAALPLIVEHTVLLNIAQWAQGEQDIVVDQTKLKLSSLVAESHVYIPPKPVFQRSKELDESLTAIRRAQEEAEYQRISTTLPTNSYKIPSSYVNISGVDPTLPLSQRISSSHTAASPLHHSSTTITTTSSSRALLRQGEEQAWKEAQQTLSVILNIFLSTLATATAAWWASGNANVGHKVLVSMLVAVVTAVAEVVLYNRYSVYVRQSKEIKSSRMKGSDLHKTGLEFKPLQLDRGTPKGRDRTKTSTLNKDPS
ncbi:uncharacterized protein UTRI_05942 [Ustilago trichophora]|uniref:ATPase, vacuolar ER assembly factor, Vma12 n=1 Tax=Ustilago trichophora TaxID=86804 RepID=A0A5C3EHQ7_9BASI|nr:uncharacterized protein UTRI_05942 [Ustilago trichophora]